MKKSLVCLKKLPFKHSNNSQINKSTFKFKEKQMKESFNFLHNKAHEIKGYKKLIYNIKVTCCNFSIKKVFH